MSLNNTVIIALSSFAGMGPYVASIVNSFSKSDRVWFVFGQDDNLYYTKNIKQELHDKSLFYTRKDTALQKLRSLVSSDRHLIGKIDSFIKKNDIRSIHLLTGETQLRGAIDRWTKEYNLYITIHDLHPHEAQKVWYKEFRMRKLYEQLEEMYKKIPNFITNSRAQLEEIKVIFPNKKSFYHSFPTLVTESIVNGTLNPQEITVDFGQKPYILFFGRIEKYKGVDLLYDVFVNTSELYNNYRLVIAGSGDIYFPRIANEKNVLFINRYIRDEEIGELYKNSLCSVYPYISATQSGVLSLSCFYQSPMLVSDVPFFRHAAEEGVALAFKNGDKNELTKRLLELVNKSSNQMKEKQLTFYHENYDMESIHKSLLSIYQKASVTICKLLK